MGDAARGIAERNQKWSLWAGRVGLLGGAYLLDRRMADATRSFRKGSRQRRGGTGVEGQLVRLLGDVVAHPDCVEVDTAEANYREALVLAEPRGLRRLVGHCHLGLGKLYRRTRRSAQAQEHLAAATRCAAR